MCGDGVMVKLSGFFAMSKGPLGGSMALPPVSFWKCVVTMSMISCGLLWVVLVIEFVRIVTLA